MRLRALDLDDLYLVHWLGKCPNIAEAARRMHISGPAVTQRIQKIEACLGYEILDRTTRMRWLNDEGMLFCKKARKALEVLGEEGFVI